MARYQEIEAQIEQHNMNSQRALERYALERKYNKAKPHQMIEYIINGEKPDTYLYHSKNKKLWGEVPLILNTMGGKHTEKYNNACHILKTVVKKANSFLDIIENVKAIKSIMEIYDERLRDVDDWKPKKNNAHTVLYDLLRHLFSTYPTPEYLVKGFVNYQLESVYLFQHIGSGKSLKAFPFVPNFQITNKCYQHILTTPEECTFAEAYRRAQILSLGGDDQLFFQLMGSTFGGITNSANYDKKNEDFWVSVIKFFIDNAMIAPEKISEIIDYINDQKFTIKRRMVEGGKMISEVDQPNFTMKGRTPMSLINQSDDWHHFLRINGKRLKDNVEWQKAEITDLKFQNGEWDYNIVQLHSAQALVDEGNTMKHCVGSYANSCARGTCAIFSFRASNYSKGIYSKSEVTLEVRLENRTKILTQAKAVRNAQPSSYYMSLVKKWCDANEIGISKYIKF